MQLLMVLRYLNTKLECSTLLDTRSIPKFRVKKQALWLVQEPSSWHLFLFITHTWAR
jgi:hypothetical protein